MFAFIDRGVLVYLCVKGFPSLLLLSGGECVVVYDRTGGDSEDRDRADGN